MLVFNGNYPGKEAGALDEESGYLLVGLDGARYKAHRLIFKYWYGVNPDTVDHINHRRSDNRLQNLRSVTFLENVAHRNPNSFSCRRSGVPGINWDRQASKWKVRIWNGVKHLNLGRFDDLDDAKSALELANLES